MSTVAPDRTAVHRPPYLVFCDVDETLISRKSMFDFLQFHLVRRYGATGQQQYERIARELRSQGDAGASRSTVNRSYYRAYTGESAAQIEALGRLWFDECATDPDFFIPGTLQELARHRGAGAEIVLVSGSFLPCLAPIAERVGAGHILCTTPIVLDGSYTGEVIEPVIGEGKRSAVLRMLADHPGVNPLACFAFGDHPSDFPMLDCVGHPRGVGEDPLLREYLTQRHELPSLDQRGTSGCALACWSMGSDGLGDGHGASCRASCALPLD
ncbi:HAD family hydrolase [Kitasatospora sp. GAS1066B]|uniref:HAD family hydrolase n=1 Tax=Kitasatospora sp. GAS1066B TaxID=3156271 RepID=UPI0035160718